MLAFLRRAFYHDRMPTYVYAVVKPDGSLGEHFEVVQKMSDAALAAHPETGEPVRRVPQAPMVNGQHSDASDKRKLSDSNLDRLGFTKYQKVGDGKYEKTAGVGPKSITRE
jgi:predicted nucleic acid-binding Zn ribbon protein